MLVNTLGAGIQNPAMYAYGFDNKYQLAGATFGAPNFGTGTFAASSAFAEKNLNYDANGNIKGLQRTNTAGALSDDFSSYQYQSGTNKLNSVGNSSNANAYASYTYNELGQLKSEVKTGSPFNYYVKYDVTGKITGIYADAAYATLKVGYAYDEAGNRISRTDNTGPSPVTTYYVYDASSNSMAIYTGATLSEMPFYGADRLGTYTVSGNNYVYELRDNVGSVRVVINRNKIGGQADIIQYNDYYPFGSLSQSGGNGYRYDYQGAYAEKDEVTGWNNFDLRMYDGRIGRWLSVDPEGQYFSPYKAMGNNPITISDPTGGSWTEWVKGAKGIYWDPNANSQETTKTGEVYLGKTLYFNFTSFIDGTLWDGPLGRSAAGAKLTSIVAVTGTENSRGELTGITATKQIIPGPTPVGSARLSYPGLGRDQNSASISKTIVNGLVTEFKLNFEQHASVSWFEEWGLRLLAFDIPNVTQKMLLNYSNNRLSVSSFTDNFPSAILSVNGQNIMYFAQPSFYLNFHNPDYSVFSGPRVPGPSYIAPKLFKR